MKIQTSYFARISKVENPVAICAFPPKWADCPNYLPLAPPESLLRKIKNGTITKSQFTKRYTEQLCKLDAFDVVQELRQLTKSNNICLLCFEKSHDFCHRHIAADWLRMEAGIIVSEYRPVKISNSLFSGLLK